MFLKEQGWALGFPNIDKCKRVEENRFIIAPASLERRAFTRNIRIVQPMYPPTVRCFLE